MAFTKDYDINETSSGFPDPFMDYTSRFMPTDMHKLYEWSEKIYYFNPTFRQAVNRIARYPITALSYAEEENTDSVKQYKNFFDKELDFKTQLAYIGIDLLVYGNCFVSVFLPFDRMFQCPACGLEVTPSSVDFKYKEGHFVGICLCKEKVKFKVKDIISKDSAKINLIRWDPKHIEVNFNQITGSSVYYWSIPAEYKTRVENNDQDFLAEIPRSILDTIVADKKFRFSKNKIYHFKEESLAGVLTKYGLPTAVSLFKPEYYISLLRRANEAIALDYIIPFRIIYPLGSSNANEPTTHIPLQKFTRKMESMIENKRFDNTNIQISPIPIGYQAIGGEGKTLNVHQEIKFATEEMLNGLGYPAELYYGTLTVQAVPTALRLFQNTWSHLIHGYNRFIQWVSDTVSDYLDWEKMQVSLTPITIADDIERKQILMQLASSGIISMGTALEPYGIDINKEHDKKLDEQRAMMDADLKMQKMQKELMKSVDTGQGGAEGQVGGSVYDVHTQAQQIANQLLANFDSGMVRSELQNIEETDKNLYALVKMYMDQMRSQAQSQVGREALDQGLTQQGYGGVSAGTQPMV